MNAAVDQQCELYIKEKMLEKEVQKKIDVIYKGRNVHLIKENYQRVMMDLV